MFLHELRKKTSTALCAIQESSQVCPSRSFIGMLAFNSPSARVLLTLLEIDADCCQALIRRHGTSLTVEGRRGRVRCQDCMLAYLGALIRSVNVRCPTSSLFQLRALYTFVAKHIHSLH